MERLRQSLTEGPEVSHQPYDSQALAGLLLRSRAIIRNLFARSTAWVYHSAQREIVNMLRWAEHADLQLHHEVFCIVDPGREG